MIIAKLPSNVNVHSCQNLVYIGEMCGNATMQLYHTTEQL